MILSDNQLDIIKIMWSIRSYYNQRIALYSLDSLQKDIIENNILESTWIINQRIIKYDVIH